MYFIDTVLYILFTGNPKPSSSSVQSKELYKCNLISC